MKNEIEELTRLAIEAGEREEKIRELGSSLQTVTEKLRGEIDSSAGYARNPNLNTEELYQKAYGSGRRAADHVVEQLRAERNSLTEELKSATADQKLVSRQLESLTHILGDARDEELRIHYIGVTARIKSSILFFCENENEAGHLASAFSVSQNLHKRIGNWRRFGQGASKARSLAAELMAPLPRI